VKPKILIFDIETAPNLSYTWGIWEQNVIKVVRPWYILAFSAKWLRGTQTTKGLIDYTNYRKNRESDEAIVKEIWKLFNEADIVVAHNGDAFDIKKCSARFTFHGLTPPSPYQTVDTLKIARRTFAFDSNKLDEIGKLLKIGEKLKHEGFALWERCMAGDKKAWRKMKRYNGQDVRLLEDVYLTFLPWMKSHPNLGNFAEKPVCPKCGSNKTQFRGVQRLSTGSYRRIQCNNCHGWSRENKPISKTNTIKSI
jgi:DNA polymerase elongation subunit (family B)